MIKIESFNSNLIITPEGQPNLIQLSDDEHLEIDGKEIDIEDLSDEEKFIYFNFFNLGKNRVYFNIDNTDDIKINRHCPNATIEETIDLDYNDLDNINKNIVNEFIKFIYKK